MTARAWCNNEVAYLAWSPPPARINGLLGFMIVRVHAAVGGDPPERRLLPAWVAFKGQHNPNWKPQDTSVWPIQKFSWRDLTLRRSRDSLSVREPFSCHYQIVPVGLAAAGRQSVTEWLQQNPAFSSADPANYQGAPVELFVAGPAIETNEIQVTSTFGAFDAVFTNGILSTQNLRLQLNVPAGQRPTAALLRTHTRAAGDPIRDFLTADVLPALKAFVESVGPNDRVYAALYELTDTELVGLLKGLGQRLHLILSTAGSPPKGQSEWDGENAPARQALHQTAAEVCDRMFNTTARIGHNKFLVHTDGQDRPLAVLTGSTNWTDTGLCTQSNNTIVSRSVDLAQAYLDYWRRLKADTATFPQQADLGAPNHNVQKGPLRTADGKSYPAADIPAPAAARLWCSPNTHAASNSKDSPPPADLTDVFALMRQAKHAILFLTFMPSVEGKHSIIEQACALGAENPDLLVQGAISSPEAMPNHVVDPKGSHLPAPAVFSPPNAPQVLTIRAAALAGGVGDFEPELLSAGFAIIHDKIVVIDPFSDDCVVVTGSHNLGYKASYCNDDNLLIIQGEKALAQAYAVHVLDVYEHYRFRAVQEQRQRDAMLAGHAAPPAPDEGFLSAVDTWQDDYVAGRRGRELSYFLA
jgi:phosphatidylserine/phosphatidylglycerophosphate/cardiolipin synthase-like enzyme